MLYIKMLILNPVIKWLGGKRRLLKHILPRIPKNFKYYHEPFFGAGAVFFAMQPKYATINDLNPLPILMLKMMRDHYEEISKECQKLIPFINLKDFLILKKTFNTKAWNLNEHEQQIEKTGLFIYVCKLLLMSYQEVADHHIIGSMGFKFENVKLFDANNFKKVADFLKQRIKTISLFSKDYVELLQYYKPGDFVY